MVLYTFSPVSSLQFGKILGTSCSDSTEVPCKLTVFTDEETLKKNYVVPFPQLKYLCSFGKE